MYMRVRLSRGGVERTAIMVWPSMPCCVGTEAFNEKSTLYEIYLKSWNGGCSPAFLSNVNVARQPFDSLILANKWSGKSALEFL